MTVESGKALIKKYRLYCQKRGKVLVGHPVYEEVRVGSVEKYFYRYSESELGQINPLDRRWWRAMAEFVNVKIGNNLDKELPCNHYLLGTV